MKHIDDMTVEEIHALAVLQPLQPGLTRRYYLNHKHMQDFLNAGGMIYVDRENLNDEFCYIEAEYQGVTYIHSCQKNCPPFILPPPLTRH